MHTPYPAPSWARDLVDGDRVDISLQDPVLWDEVCDRSAAAGHGIVVFPEGLPRYHFCQGDSIAFSPDLGRDWEVDGTRIATVQISSHDGGWQSGPGNHYSVRGSRARFGGAALLSHRIPLFFGGEEFDADQVSLPGLSRGLYGSGGPGGWRTDRSCAGSSSTTRQRPPCSPT